MPASPAHDRLEAPVEAVLRDAGYELVALKVVPRGGGLSLQVFIDHPEGEEAVTLGDCARASRLIQERIDLDRHLAGRYVLEVSSPGVDRPLTRPAHYRRFRGQPVTVRLVAERSGRRVLHGTIAEADEEGVTVALEDGGSERLRFEEIAGAQLKVDVWKASRARKSASGREE